MPLLTDRFAAALTFALDHHHEDLRKGTQIPYASHLLSVASLVLDMESGSEDEAIAALLHDVVEDGGGPAALEAIRAQFGEEVASIVEQNSDSLTGEAVKAPWEQRKADYIAAIAHKTPGALRVSVADKLHNARAILTDLRTHGEPLFDRFKAGGGDAVAGYYRRLADAFDARAGDLGEGGRTALRELRLTVDAIDAERLSR